MKVGRVVATVVSTICAPVFRGRRLLLCELDEGEHYVIAVDAVGAGAGEQVLILDEGNSARQILEAPEAPVRAVVAAIIDHIEISS